MAPWMGLVLGGLVPAVGYALFGIFTKLATNAGVGPGANLMLVGLSTAVAGLVFQWALPGIPTTGRGAFWSVFAGLLWGVGTGLVSYTLIRFGIPISKLNPIYNANTLLAVVLGLVIFAEWKQVDPLKLGLGALLILAGALLVSKA